jgi:hypothetical protein
LLDMLATVCPGLVMFARSPTPCDRSSTRDKSSLAHISLGANRKDYVDSTRQQLPVFRSRG